MLLQASRNVILQSLKTLITNFLYRIRKYTNIYTGTTLHIISVRDIIQLTLVLTTLKPAGIDTKE